MIFLFHNMIWLKTYTVIYLALVCIILIYVPVC